MSKLPVTKPYASGPEEVTVEFGVPYRNNAGSTTEWSEIWSAYFTLKNYFYDKYLVLFNALTTEEKNFFTCSIEKSTDLASLKKILSNTMVSKCNVPASLANTPANARAFKNHIIYFLNNFNPNKFVTLFLHPGIDYDLHPTLTGYVDVTSPVIQAVLKQRPIYSIADGRVLYSQSAGAAWSGIVFMEHVVKCKNKNKELYFYASYNHMYPGSISNLKVGSFYKKNTKLGFLGLGSTSTGVHLHFEIRAKSDYSQVINLKNDAVTTDFGVDIPKIGGWGTVGEVKFNMLGFLTINPNVSNQEKFIELYPQISTNEKISKFIVKTEADKFLAIKNFLLFKEFKSSQTASTILNGYKDPYPTIEEINFQVTDQRKAPFALE